MRRGSPSRCPGANSALLKPVKHLFHNMSNSRKGSAVKSFLVIAWPYERRLRTCLFPTASASARKPRWPTPGAKWTCRCCWAPPIQRHRQRLFPSGHIARNSAASMTLRLSPFGVFAKSSSQSPIFSMPSRVICCAFASSASATSCPK